MLTEWLPGESLGATAVRRTGGYFRIDVTTKAGDAIAALGESEGATLANTLLWTAYSNGAVDAVQLTVAGDCLTWAYAVGGDQCATVSLRDHGVTGDVVAAGER